MIRNNIGFHGLGFRDFRVYKRDPEFRKLQISSLGSDLWVRMF